MTSLITNMQVIVKTGSGTVVCFVCLFVAYVLGVSASHAGGDRRLSAQGYTEEALERLSQVFGIDQVPSMTHHRSPPEYMLELYHSVAYSDGITRRANPYHADVVRGFPDRATRHQTHYYFNTSFMEETEDVLAAELRLFKIRPDRVLHDIHQRTPTQHVVVLRLYEVTSERWEHVTGGLTLLDQRQVSAHATGWQVFTVTDTLRNWVNGSHINYGFLVTATTLGGQSVNGTYVRFAQRLQHHDSKQPVLVVFSGDMVPQYVLSKDKHKDMSASNEDGPVSDQGSPLEDQGSPVEALESVRQSYIQFLNEQHRAENGGSFPHERYRSYMSSSQHERLLRESRHARQVHDRRPRSRSSSRPKRDARSAAESRARTAAVSRSKTTAESRSRAAAESRSRVAAESRSRTAAESRSRVAAVSRSRKAAVSRSRRGSDYYKPSKRRNKACERHELYVDFAEIGWSGWIISPKGYNAYHCWGECPFPLGQYHRPTNHATVQSIVYTMRIDKRVQLPCCVPDKLYSISLLYFDDEENVILKQYNEMVAASCGCH